jgi:hypothetical protein
MSSGEPRVFSRGLEPDALALHAMLLDHRSRTASLAKAVRATVRTGDVVVDLGAGTGILGLAALRAGAARVYAIEASAMAGVVRRVAALNGVADQMTVIRGWSQDVELPERADVVVSELVGDEPLAEGVLAITADAARRFLKPKGRMVPSGLQVLATPMQLPRAVREEAVIGNARVRRWQQWYGFDFSPLLEPDLCETAFDFVNPWDARAWRPLGPSVLLADFELGTSRPPEPMPVALRIERHGRLDAVLLHFELRAAGRMFLSTEVSEVDESNHWRSPVVYLRQAPPVGKADGVTLSYRPGGPSGLPRCLVRRRAEDGTWMLIR